MPCRRLAIAVASAILAVVLTACTPEPAATPTPTGFASEEEAFAAAEETYRAYVDALNLRNAGDEDADPAAYLTGEMLESEKEVEDLLKETGRSFHGTYILTGFTPTQFSQIETSASVTATACMDSTDVVVLDEAGNDVTPSDDQPIYSLDIELVTIEGEMLISTSELASASC